PFERVSKSYVTPKLRMSTDAAVVANRGPADAVDDAELANPRIVPDVAREVSMHTGLMVELAVVTEREVRASYRYSLSDVAVSADNDPVCRPPIRTGNFRGGMDDGAAAYLDVFR